MPQQIDYLSQLAQLSQTPQALPTYESSKQQPSGFMGAGGKIAMLADSFLGGLSKGRAQAYQHSQGQINRQIQGISAKMEEVSSSSLPDEVKQQQLSQLGAMRGQIFMHALDGQDSGKSKSKKGGDLNGPSGASTGKDAGGEGPGAHVLTAIKSITQAMLGPGAQKAPVDPKDIDAALHQTTELLKQAPQIQQQHNVQVAQGLTGIIQATGKPADQVTSGDLFKNPQWAAFLAKNPNHPAVKQFTDTVQQNDQRADPKYQAQLKEIQSRTDWNNLRDTKTMANAKGELFTTSPRVGGGLEIKDSTGKTVPDPGGLHEVGKQQQSNKYQVIDSKQGLFTPDLENGGVKPIVVNGRQLTSDKNDPTGRFYARLNESKREFDEKQRGELDRKVADVDEKYSGLIAKAKTDKERDQLRKDQEKALDVLGGLGGTTAPPPGGGKGSAKNSLSPEDRKALDSFTQNLFGSSAPAAPATSAPPQQAGGSGKKVDGTLTVGPDGKATIQYH